MASITVQITITQTLSTLNGASLDAVITWLNANITQKLPSNASATISFPNMQP